MEKVAWAAERSEIRAVRVAGKLKCGASSFLLGTPTLRTKAGIKESIIPSEAAARGGMKNGWMTYWKFGLATVFLFLFYLKSNEVTVESKVLIPIRD